MLLRFKMFIFLCFFAFANSIPRKFDKKDLYRLREETRAMFNHAYSSYLEYAYPYDELRSLSCDGFDTWGSFSLTLIDALDTLAVMGNFSEFQRVAEIIASRTDFEANINVSVFETNIRVVGGLLSAHLLSKKAGIKVEPGWPCNGPLLHLAEDMAKRLIVAFDTPTGMPYGTVNLKYGIPPGETSITCTAGIGTFILEFGTLSRLTGDPLYEEVAMNALKALNYYKSNIGLVGNHVDVLTGQWTAQDSGIGAGVDSYFEYLAKGTLLFQDPSLASMFHEHRAAIEKYIRREDWHLWVSMTKGQVTLPVFQSLDAYWPGVLSLFGEVSDAMRSIHNYHKVWKQFGFTPEFYNIPQGEAGTNREGYPLRPELIESVMYLYRATGDPYLLEVGTDVLKSLQHSAKTTCGYATINDVRDHRKADRMESFFLAETTKYLYLLFDPDNFIHNSGNHGSIIETEWGKCVIDAGGYIFNTEAHPIDPGALYCCQRPYKLFPQKKSKMHKFVAIHERRHDDPIKLKYFEDETSSIKESNRTIEIQKLSEIKRTALQAALQSDYSSNILKLGNTISIDNKSSKENNSVILESSKMKVKVVAPPFAIYKADDSENTESLNPGNRPTKGYIGTTDGPKTRNSTFRNAEILQQPYISDPQIMLERIRKNKLYPTNMTAKENYELLGCQSQPFLQRMSIIGEFF